MERILHPRRISFDNFPDLLKEYLTQGLFEKPLPLTFELYSAPYLEESCDREDCHDSLDANLRARLQE
ncbi:MAG: hypothetical protein P1U85_07955 [Verrucomicrobiales bacterium]|nr:hypothetical protein [Verrucomicrobiales bacterium]